MRVVNFHWGLKKSKINRQDAKDAKDAKRSPYILYLFMLDFLINY